MEHSEKAAATCTSSIPIPMAAAASHSSLSPSSSSSSSPTGSPPGAAAGGVAAATVPPPCFPPPLVVLSPCAACKILRRRCVEKCVLAPYFPPTDPLKFTIAHKVFGASNIIKMLQELPEHQRGDTVNSMVYEANARIRDPIYGCAGAICQLQNQISELQAELARAKAEIFNMRCQNENLVSIICMGTSMSQNEEIISENQICENMSCMLLDGGNISDSWEPLWT